MHRMRAFLLFAGVFTALAVAPSATRSGPSSQPEGMIVAMPPDWAGEYRLAADKDARIALEHTPLPGALAVRTSLGWGAIGFWDREHFEGVLRPADLQGSPLPGPMGTLVFDVRAGRIEATIRRGDVERRETWVPEHLASDRLPEFGEYVYVEELPEALSKPRPAYPPKARQAGIEGTVMVQALVGKDGLVRDLRIVKSIPALDQAALDAVRRWKFKPARSRGAPVALWVAVPVKFSLR